MTEEKNVSEIMSNIMVGYMINGCDGCPFYGIKDKGIDQYCNAVPINCKWSALHQYFKNLERSIGKNG